MTDRSHHPSADVTILCALQHEARVLRRGLRGVRCDVHVCGPGALAVQTWATRQAQGIARDRPVILVGLAGSLSRKFAAGSAYVISEVRDASGQTIARPPLALEDHASSAIITSADAIIVNGNDRAALASASGADLVDMESVTFARAAIARGWRWGIVRGVSDDASTAIPAEACRWIAPDGGTRPKAIARSLLRNPMLVRDVLILQRHSQMALTDCVAHLRALIHFTSGD